MSWNANAATYSTIVMSLSRPLAPTRRRRVENGTRHVEHGIGRVEDGTDVKTETRVVEDGMEHISNGTRCIEDGTRRVESET